MKLRLFLLSIFILLSLVGYKTYAETKDLKSIDSYESCIVASGSIIQESYPSTCVAKSGLRFTQPTPTSESSLFPVVDMSSWRTYTNQKYNFRLKYPTELNLMPKEVNIQQDYEDYNHKCEDGTYNGCGGSRWPDYKITFFRTNGKGAFDISIWEGEDTSLYLQSIPHNGYAYSVSTFRSFDEDGEIDPLGASIIEKIYSTLEFTD